MNSLNPRMWQQDYFPALQFDAGLKTTGRQLNTKSTSKLRGELLRIDYPTSEQ